MEVTTPVYWPDEGGKPEAVGSAVLVGLGTARFLVTAAHVLDLRHKRPLRATAGGELLSIDGNVTRIFSPPADSPGADDRVDIAAVRLAGELWSQLPITAFAGWSELDHSQSVITRNSFALVGYPYTKQRRALKGTHIEARVFQTTGLESLESTYRAAGVDPGVSLLMGFSKRRLWGPGGRVMAPDLYGVSGSGLWRFGRYLRHATTPARLSGILIEWHRTGGHNYVLGTRIRPILAALAGWYPDVQEFIHQNSEGAE